MPRLSKADQAEYQKGLDEWKPKFLKALKELAGQNNNQVKRSQLMAALSMPDRFFAPITNLLLDEEKIQKTGSHKGRGSRWGVMDLPIPTAEEQKEFEADQPEPEPKKKTLTVNGKCCYFGRAVLLGRADVDEVLVVGDDEEADFTIDEVDAKEIVKRYRDSIK